MQEPRAKLGPYTIVKRLGEGPHGACFLVQRPRHKATFVLKRLHRPDEEPAGGDERLEARLLELRRELSRIPGDHPNLAGYDDAGVLPATDDQPGALYLVTPHVEGPDLFRFTARASWNVVLEVVVSALRGLEALHAQGVLHGHLVPENVLVSGQGPRKSARLLDPGLARDIAETARLGALTSFAPEVLRGDARDRRADLYDLGVLLFACATRTPLFGERDAEALIEAHLRETPPRARELKRTVPVAIEALIAALLAKDPADRPPCANAAIRELNRRASKRFSTEGRAVRLAQPLWPRLQGRERALDALAEATRAAPLSALVSEAGAGRTRLLSAAPERLAGPTWLALPEPNARALVLALAALPRPPEHDPLRREAPFLARLAPELAGELTPLAAPVSPVAALEPAAETLRLRDALARLLLAEARRLPSGLTVVIDDLHRADPLLVRALALAARDLDQARRGEPEPAGRDERVAPLAEDAPLRVIAALVPDELLGHPAEAELRALLTGPGVRQVPLDPLTPAALGDALAGALGREPAEARPLLAKLIEGRADGSGRGPAWALALLGELAERDAVPSPDGAWSFDEAAAAAVLADADLERVLARRLAARDDGPLRALAALLALHYPRRLAPDLAAAALELSGPELLGRAIELEQLGLLAPPGARADAPLALAGGSRAEALLAAISPPERARLHEALGRALAERAATTADEQAAAHASEQAAHHLLRGAVPGAGGPTALFAAERALARGEPERALELLQPAVRALEASGEPGAPAPLHPAAARVASDEAPALAQLLLGEASLALGRAGAARAAAHKALTAARAARAPRALGRALLLGSQAARASGEPARAKAASEEAVGLAREAGWSGGLARALLERGRAEAAAGDRDEALASLEEARARLAERGDAAAEAEAWREIARLRAARGDLAVALEAALRAIDLDEEGDRGGALARGLVLRADLLLAQGELDRALEIAGRAAAAAREVGDLATLALAAGAVADVLRARGELSAARRREAEALALRERAGDAAGGADARLRLVQLDLARGALGPAERQLEAAAAAIKALPGKARAARLALASAELALLRGDLSRALDALERAQDEAREGPAALAARVLEARLALAQGDLARAEERAAAAAEEAARQARTPDEIDARLALGLARLRRGRPQEAERELRDALGLAEERRDGRRCARLHLAIGEVYLLRAEPAGALDELGRARGIAQQLEDGPLEVDSLLALGRLHLFLGQLRRAATLADMALARARELGLGLAGPEAGLLQAGVRLEAADPAGDVAGERALPGAPEELAPWIEEALAPVEQAAAARRGLRAALDLQRARLALWRGEPAEAWERAAAAREACRITGEARLAAEAERLGARARSAQQRHEEALASAERAVNEADGIQDGEARALALLERGRAHRDAGRLVEAVHDLREAASQVRGIWASLPEDLRGDYEHKPLVREIITIARELTEAALAARGPEPAAVSRVQVAAALVAASAATAAPAARPAAPAGGAEGGDAAPAGDDALESLRDPLTNLYNHTFFTAQLDTEVKRGLRHSRPLALLKINIDRFKLVRELYGPKAAKGVIRDVAELLLRNVRDVDIVARYFGDEFEVLLPDTEARGAMLTAARIAEAVDGHRFTHEDEKIELTLTLGIATFPRDAKDKDALICRADEALYNARSRGPGQVFAFGGAEEPAAEASPELRELDQLMLTREGRTILSMVSRLVNQELDIDRVIELVTGMVVEATRGERGFIMLKGSAGEFTFRHGRNIDDKVINTPELKISNSIAKDVARTGKAVHVSEAIEDDRFRDFKSVMDLNLRSIICAPIKVGDDILGVIYVDHNQVARNFTPEDLNFLVAIAEKVAIPINNSRRLRETEDRLALAEARLKSQAAQLQTKYKYESIIGRSEPMQKVFKLLDRIVETNHSVVIHGESGTGKELIARAIHFNGPRKSRPFVAENCAALSDTLLEAELFGHVKGAFTGADRDSKGLFELANGGTLFLDEIGDMSERMQKKLLRVLQEGEVRPVGGKRVFHVDVRIVSASNKDLKKLVQEGKFREDLYYRLNVITVNLPPLRERRDDIVLLAEHFIEKHSEAGAERKLDRETLRYLINYDWPGNVRELENEINRLVAMSDDIVTPDVLSPKIREGAPSAAKGGDGMARYFGRPLKEVEYEFMRELINYTLEQTNWHRTKAAQLLKVPTSTLFNKMKKYGIG